MAIPFNSFGGDGPLLHFAHANGYPPGCYRQFLTALGARFTVRAIQHRPLWSEMDPWQMQDWHLVTADLIDLFDAQGWRNVIGVGHSLGGVATMYAALERPDLFRALVLLDPVFLPAPWLAYVRAHPAASPEMHPLVEGALRRREFWESEQEAFERFRPKSIFQSLTDDALWDYTRAILKPANGGYTLAYPRQWEARFYSLPPTDVWECVPRLTQPTLAVRGAESDTLHPEAWALWQTLQPQAIFIELPRLGHLMAMEEPSGVAQIVCDYLEKLA